jgi:hypothetical protein
MHVVAPQADELRAKERARYAKQKQMADDTKAANAALQVGATGCGRSASGQRAGSGRTARLVWLVRSAKGGRAADGRRAGTERASSTRQRVTQWAACAARTQTFRIMEKEREREQEAAMEGESWTQPCRRLASRGTRCRLLARGSPRASCPASPHPRHREAGPTLALCPCVAHLNRVLHRDVPPPAAYAKKKQELVEERARREAEKRAAKEADRKRAADMIEVRSLGGYLRGPRVLAQMLCARCAACQRGSIAAAAWRSARCGAR